MVFTIKIAFGFSIIELKNRLTTVDSFYLGVDCVLNIAHTRYQTLGVFGQKIPGTMYHQGNTCRSFHFIYTPLGYPEIFCFNLIGVCSSHRIFL